ncbi:hypothetical protein KUCAC02_002267, partial [Chaenocephalus aceratus]
SSWRYSSTCTWPLRETSVEQAILIALPHTALPAPLMPQHHPSAPLYSQRKSPFPEAITLGTLGSGRSVTYGLGQDRLQLVFVQQKQQHIWLSTSQIYQWTPVPSLPTHRPHPAVTMACRCSRCLKQTGVQGQFLQAQGGKTLEKHRSEWAEEAWADKDRSWRKESRWRKRGLGDLFGRQYQGRGTCRTWPDSLTSDLSSCQSCSGSQETPKGLRDEPVCVRALSS